MAVFLTLFYTSVHEIPSLLYISSLREDTLRVSPDP